MVMKSRLAGLATAGFRCDMAKVRFEYDAKKLNNNVRNFDRKLNRAMSGLFDYNALYATGWLKEHAPWHDDTGAARSGLVALANNGRNAHELLMAYSVTYGIWLEVAHSGQWAVITPAMRIVGNKIMDDIRTLLRAIT